VYNFSGIYLYWGMFAISLLSLMNHNVMVAETEVSKRRHRVYVSFGQGSSLLWTHTLRPLYSRPIALTQEGGVRLMMCASVCVTEG